MVNKDEYIEDTDLRFCPNLMPISDRLSPYKEMRVHFTHYKYMHPGRQNLNTWNSVLAYKQPVKFCPHQLRFAGVIREKPIFQQVCITLSCIMMHDNVHYSDIARRIRTCRTVYWNFRRFFDSSSKNSSQVLDFKWFYFIIFLAVLLFPNESPEVIQNWLTEGLSIHLVVGLSRIDFISRSYSVTLEAAGSGNRSVPSRKQDKHRREVDSS